MPGYGAATAHSASGQSGHLRRLALELTARKQQRLAVATAPATAARDGAPASPPPSRMSPRRAAKLVPWFLIGFVLVAAVNSCGIIPAGAHAPLEHASVFLVSVALSAIGLSTNVAALRKAGVRPLLLGAQLWITVATASLGLQALTGTL